MLNLSLLSLINNNYCQPLPAANSKIYFAMWENT